MTAMWQGVARGLRAQVANAEKFRPAFQRVPAPASFVRAFSTPRVTDASRQPGLGEKVPPRRMEVEAPSIVVPQITPAQEEAAAAVKAAEEAFVAAKAAAAKTAMKASVLQDLAYEWTVHKRKADDEVANAKQALDAALGGQKRADIGAAQVLRSAADQEKHFLKNSFHAFDADKTGVLTPKRIQEILDELQLPSDNTAVDEVVECLDISKDGLIQEWEWVNHLPGDVKQALQQHSSAPQWQA